MGNFEIVVVAFTGALLALAVTGLVDLVVRYLLPKLRSRAAASKPVLPPPGGSAGQSLMERTHGYGELERTAVQVVDDCFQGGGSSMSRINEAQAWYQWVLEHAPPRVARAAQSAHFVFRKILWDGYTEERYTHFQSAMIELRNECRRDVEQQAPVEAASSESEPEAEECRRQYSVASDEVVRRRS